MHEFQSEEEITTDGTDHTDGGPVAVATWCLDDRELPEKYVDQRSRNCSSLNPACFRMLRNVPFGTSSVCIAT